MGGDFVIAKLFLQEKEELVTRINLAVLICMSSDLYLLVCDSANLGICTCFPFRKTGLFACRFASKVKIKMKIEDSQPRQQSCRN